MMRRHEDGRQRKRARGGRESEERQEECGNVGMYGR